MPTAPSHSTHPSTQSTHRRLHLQLFSFRRPSLQSTCRTAAHPPTCRAATALGSRRRRSRRTRRLRRRYRSHARTSADKAPCASLDDRKPSAISASSRVRHLSGFGAHPSSAAVRLSAGRKAPTASSLVHLCIVVSCKHVNFLV